MMARIKCLYLGVAVGAERNTVFERIRTAIRLLFDVMTDESGVLTLMTETACALASHQCL